MTNVADRPRPWRFPGLLLEDHIVFGSLMWAGLVLVTMAIAVGLDLFTEVSGSIWEQSSQVAAWYVAGVGGYVIYETVPMFITHGRTRRSAGVETVIFMVVFAAVAAVLIAVGYLIEYIVFDITDWSRNVSGDRLFTSHMDVPMIVTQYWLTFIVWSAAGALVGAAFYRYDAKGWMAIIPAAILIGLADIFTRTPWEPIGGSIDRMLPVESPSPALAALVSIACFVIGIALTWPILRDIPIRNR